jgi:hypothetical protein
MRCDCDYAAVHMLTHIIQAANMAVRLLKDSSSSTSAHLCLVPLWLQRSSSSNSDNAKERRRLQRVLMESIIILLLTQLGERGCGLGNSFIGEIGDIKSRQIGGSKGIISQAVTLGESCSILCM